MVLTDVVSVFADEQYMQQFISGSNRKFDNLAESEGVLMIITEYGIIVFQLMERIAIVKKSSIEVNEESKNMLAFSYLVIPTRHEVHIEPIG